MIWTGGCIGRAARVSDGASVGTGMLAIAEPGRPCACNPAHGRSEDDQRTVTRSTNQSRWIRPATHSDVPLLKTSASPRRNVAIIPAP